MTKLCGIRSVFSKRISTGLPACTTSRSLSKSIWSGTVPRRITRTPSSPSSLRTCLASFSGSKDGEGVGQLQGVERLVARCAPERARCERSASRPSSSGFASSFGQ